MSELGLKYDSDKPRMDLIPPEAEVEEAMVWGYGAKKYAAHNFRGGILYSKIIAAAKRHMNKIQSGEDWDIDAKCDGCVHGLTEDKSAPDSEKPWVCMTHSGRKHWACIRCCMGMLAVMEIEHPEMDDRYKAPKKEVNHVER